jgi:hypothetical protein
VKAETTILHNENVASEVKNVLHRADSAFERKRRRERRRERERERRRESIVAAEQRENIISVMKEVVKEVMKEERRRDRERRRSRDRERRDREQAVSK